MRYIAYELFLGYLLWKGIGSERVENFSYLMISITWKLSSENLSWRDKYLEDGQRFNLTTTQELRNIYSAPRQLFLPQWH